MSSQHIYFLKQCVVWQRLSVHLGWQCDNVRASYDEISKAVQDEVYAGAKAFASENKGRYECGGYIYSGEGQDIGQFWAKLAVGNATLKKTSSNASITDGNGLYSIAGATYGVYSDKDCTKQLATLTTDNSGNTDTVEVKAGTVYIKELSAPAGYKVDSTVYSLNVEAGKTATLNVSDTPKVTDTLIELFKIDMETQKDAPQGDASLEGAEFTWKFYAGHYTADNLPSEPTKTWVTKTIAEKDGDIAVLSGSNQYHVSDKVIRGGVKIQKRDLETSDTKGQGSATLKDAEFEIISLNDNAVLVEGKLYSKNEVVKTILTDIEGVASTSADLLPYGKYRIEESKAPLAEELTKAGVLSMNAHQTIYITSPEYNSVGQMIFRDNVQPMINGKNVLILNGAVTTGETLARAVESVLYYGGQIRGIAAIFSAVTSVARLPVYSIFQQRDIPDYGSQ